MAKHAASSMPEAVGQLPLFFRNPQPLDPQRHARAGLAPVLDLSFSAKTNSIAINAVEFFEAAKFYPIVFMPGAVPLPGVIVGLENSHYFVDAKGHWRTGAYVPAYVRKYPFLFLDLPDEQKLVLCIDEGAPEYKAQGARDAVAFFEGNAPSPMAKNALEFCKSYHQHFLFTKSLGEDLMRAGVLSPSQSTTQITGGREIQLGGFLVVDEKKVADLPDDVVLDFHKRGILPLLYAALISASNWKRLADMAHVMEKR
jgi:hypothetical protein